MTSNTVTISESHLCALGKHPAAHIQAWGSDPRYGICRACGSPVWRDGTSASQAKRDRVDLFPRYKVGDHLRLVNTSGRLRPHHHAGTRVWVRAVNRLYGGERFYVVSFLDRPELAWASVRECDLARDEPSTPDEGGA